MDGTRVDANLGIYLNYKVDEHLKLQFAIHNLFDRRFYADEAAYGRTCTLGATYSF